MPCIRRVRLYVSSCVGTDRAKPDIRAPCDHASSNTTGDMAFRAIGPTDSRTLRTWRTHRSNDDDGYSA